LIVTTALLCLVPAIAAAQSRTIVKLHNATDDAQEVGIVMPALGGACPESNPPIKANELAALGFCSNVVNAAAPTFPYAGKCSLTIPPNGWVTFPDIPGKCTSGNVTFGAPDGPSCPSADLPTGVTTAEFTLNTGDVDEAIDVSLVNGYNTKVKMTTEGGGADWTYGPSNTAISEIVAKHLGANAGNPGVYPENCTDCIHLVGDPVCPGFSTNPTCQGSRICNVQRAGTDSGGTVMITLESAAFTAPQPSEPGPLGPLAACAGTPSDAAIDFFANIRNLQETDLDLVDHSACPSFCQRARRACIEVAKLARRCLDHERTYARRVSARACDTAADPASCVTDLHQETRQDKVDTRTDLATAQAFCRGELLDDCLSRCDAM
jgi:hypothetical protein